MPADTNNTENSDTPVNTDFSDKTEPNFLSNEKQDNPSVDTRSFFQKKRFKLPLILGILFLIVGVTGIIGIILLSTSRQDQNQEKITVENVDEEDVTNLARQIEYGGTSEGADYYSPSLDVIFSYPEEFFTIAESTGYISITPKGAYTLLVKMQVLDNVRDAKSFYRDQYEEQYDAVSVVKEEDLEGDVHLVQFSYEQEAFLQTEDEKLQTVYRTVLIREIDTNYVAIEIKENEGTVVTDSWIDKLSDILKTVELNPENVAQEIAAYVNDANMKVTFDRTKWNVDTQQDYSLSLSYRTREFEDNDDLKYSTTSFYVYNTSFYGYETPEADEAYLIGKLEEDVSTSQEIYDEESFTIIKENESVQIGGLMFYYTSFSYKYEYNDYTTVQTTYYGYNPETNSIVNIETKKPQEESAGGAQLATLLDAISFNSGEDVSGAVQVLGTNALEIDKAALFGKPAVTQIFTKQCADITISNVAGFNYIAGNTYSLCVAASGSGFYVHKDGYIATNAHVAAGNPKDNVFSAVQLAIGANISGEPSVPVDPDGFGQDLLQEAIAYYSDQYPSLNVYDPEVQQQLIDTVFGMVLLLTSDPQYEGIATISNVTYDNWVQKDEPFEFDIETLGPKDPTSVYATELVAYREINGWTEIYYRREQGEDIGVDVPDLALLKVIDAEYDEFPALRLADINTMREGEEIYAIGFPGRANDEQTFSKEASVIPTITNGTISAIKPNHNNTFNVIQIDASVAHGNSGGPIINTNGEVVGVVALLLFGTEEKTDLPADFNAGVSVEELTALMEEEGVSQDVGVVTAVLEDGLDHFANQYYEWAIDEFKNAKSMYPPLEELLNPMIAIAQKKIDAGEDNTPVFTIGDIYIHQNEAIIAVVVVACLVLGFIILIVVFLLSIIFRKKESSPPPVRGGYTQTPVQPMQPQQGGMGYQQATSQPGMGTPPGNVAGLDQSGGGYMPAQPLMNEPAQGSQPYVPSQQSEMQESQLEEAPIQPQTEPVSSQPIEDNPMTPPTQQAPSEQGNTQDQAGIHRPEQPFRTTMG